MEEKIGIIIGLVLWYAGWVVLLRKNHPNRITRRRLTTAGVLLVVGIFTSIVLLIGLTYMWLVLLRKEKTK